MSDRLYPARPIIAASIAVFRDGKVLLAARKETAANPVYSLPGGLVEIGETLRQAALRELLTLALQQLHEGSIARYRLRRSEYIAWQHAQAQT